MRALFLIVCLIQFSVLSAQTGSSNKADTSERKIIRIGKALIVPGSLISLGVIGTAGTDIIDKYSIQEKLRCKNQKFNTHIDNYLQYLPIGLVYGMDLVGYKGRHDIWNQTALLVKSELLMTAIVYPLKKLTDVKRPFNIGDHSFPSGHTAQAFLSAEFLRKEYGKEHPLLAITGYITATAVGALRVMNNRHWITDVLAGAGIGILSVNLVYLTHQNKWPLKRKKIDVMPTFTGNGGGIYLCYHLGK